MYILGMPDSSIVTEHHIISTRPDVMGLTPPDGIEGLRHTDIDKAPTPVSAAVRGDGVARRRATRTPEVVIAHDTVCRDGHPRIAHLAVIDLAVTAVPLARVATPPTGARVLLIHTGLIERHDDPVPAITVLADIHDAVTASALGDAHLLLQPDVRATLLASGTPHVTARYAHRRRQAGAHICRHREAT
jgi:hypothetical protein